MADPTVISCTDACTVTVVHELSLPPLQLSTYEAGQIAVAILGVWAIAFGFRMLIRVLGVADKPVDQSE